MAVDIKMLAEELAPLLADELERRGMVRNARLASPGPGPEAAWNENGVPRCTDPTPHRNRWRIRLRSPDGIETVESFDTEKEAQSARRAVERAVQRQDVWARYAELASAAEEARRQAEALDGGGKTVGELIDEYIAYLRGDRGCRKSTYQTAEFKLRGILAQVEHRLVQSITPGDPWAEVEPIGRVRRGKEHLRPDEARKLFEHCLEVATTGGPKERDGAIAALVARQLGHSGIAVIERHTTPRPCGGGAGARAAGRHRGPGRPGGEQSRGSCSPRAGRRRGSPRASMIAGCERGDSNPHACDTGT